MSRVKVTEKNGQRPRSVETDVSRWIATEISWRHALVAEVLGRLIETLHEKGVLSNEEVVEIVGDPHHTVEFLETLNQKESSCTN